MTHEREFPVQAPPRRLGFVSLALIGAGVVAAVLAVRHLAATDTPVTSPLVEEASKVAAQSKEALAAAAQAAARPAVQASANPNLISGTGATEAMVPASALDRAKERAASAEKRIKDLEKSKSALERQVQELHAQLDAERRAKIPPPPPAAEDILNTLRPVLNREFEKNN